MRGQLSPLLLKINIMHNQKIISDIITEYLEGTDKFLVEIKLRDDNRIHVFLDSDNGLTIDDCVDVHRFIESKLDREKEDFELLVSSSGIDKGFIVRRQYIKNIGRDVEVTVHDNKKVNGKLIAVDDEAIEIELQKTKNKKKDDDNSKGNIKILFKDIKEAKAIISFRKK